MKIRNMKDLVALVKKLYFKYEEMANYIIFGALTSLVSIVVKYALLFTVVDRQNALHIEGAVCISWIAAVTFAYVTNRKYVFKSKSQHVFKEAVKFYGSRGLTLGMESALMWLFITLLQMNSDKEVAIITLLVQFAVIVANYFLSKFIVFTKKEEKAKVPAILE